MKPRTEACLLFTFLLTAALLLFPEAAFCSEAGGDRWGPWLTIGRFFNLALVICVLIWVARKPLANFYASRTTTIREQLAEAQKAREEAEAKLAEVEARMSNLDAELRAMKEVAEKEGQDEFARLAAAAERDAQKVIDRARQEIEGMTRAAEIELKAHAAELAVQLAEEQIRHEISPEDRQRLFSRFVTKIGGIS
jgi:F-type H+-transporting ATPase subunit b